MTETEYKKKGIKDGAIRRKLGIPKENNVQTGELISNMNSKKVSQKERLAILGLI